MAVLRAMLIFGTVGGCTCEKASDGGFQPLETDFTTKA
jgi:hypothetical protein